MGFELILPFLTPIADLILDDSISDIMVNGPHSVWIERRGRKTEVTGVTLDEYSLQIGIQNIARLLGDDFSEEKPWLDARLPDGSRVVAIQPPIAVDGIAMAIRKFGAKFFTPAELVALGTMTDDVLRILSEAITNRENILISGGTGTGKTTLLNALSTFFPHNHRVITIEEPAELRIERPNLVRLEARREQPPYPAVEIRELVRLSLRLNPDIIIVGEVRGKEAFDLWQAWNSGHSGSITTIHANTPHLALMRMASCIQMSGVAVDYAPLRASFAETIQYILQVERLDDRRVVRQLVRVGHYHPETDRFTLDVLYEGGSASGRRSSPPSHAEPASDSTTPQP